MTTSAASRPSRHASARLECPGRGTRGAARVAAAATMNAEAAISPARPLRGAFSRTRARRPRTAQRTPEAPSSHPRLGPGWGALWGEPRTASTAWGALRGEPRTASTAGGLFGGSHEPRPRLGGLFGGSHEPRPRLGGSSGGAAALPPGASRLIASAGAEPRRDWSTGHAGGAERRLHLGTLHLGTLHLGTLHLGRPGELGSSGPEAR